MDKIIFICAGFVFLLWFLAPFFSKKILNIGNITGIILSLLLIGFGAEKDFLTEKLTTSVVGNLLLILLLFLLLYVITVSFLMASASKKAIKKDCTLVVLGCKVYGTKASRMLMERIQAAYRYLSKHKNTYCIVSGGKGDDEDISEAECMYQTLISMGIDANRIYREPNSVNTRQNIAFSMEIIQKNHLPEALSIVTNEFHLYRSLNIAKKQGYPAYGIPAKTAWWLFPTYYVRELLCIAYERIRKS